MTDTSDRLEGQQADTAESPEGQQWQTKYNGLQRLLGQRTNDLAEARRIAEEATARAEQAERAAREYADLATALSSPPDIEYAQPAAQPTDVDEPEPFIHANNPRRAPFGVSVPSTADDLEAQLHRTPWPEEWGWQNKRPNRV